MLTSGKLIVRQSSSVGGRLIMNSYETKLCSISADNFVMVLYTYAPGNNLELECICPDFKKTSGEGALEMDPSGEWMSNRTRCMHTRLLYEEFEESIKNIPYVTLKGDIRDNLLQQLRESSIAASDQDAVVVSDDNLVVVSVSLKPGDLPVFVKINPKTHDTTSQCKCTNRLIRYRPKYWYTDNTQASAFCKHIQAVDRNFHLIMKYMPGDQELVNKPKSKMESFSREEGKWISASLLTHKPKQRGDASYHKYVIYDVHFLC